MALRDSMIRDISPPDAHFATSTALRPADEKRNTIESRPVADNGVSAISTSNIAYGSSSPRIDSWIAAANSPACLHLASFRRDATSSSSVIIFESCPASSSLFSSSCVESNRASERLSRKAISSASSRHECFCIRLYINDMRSSTSIKRDSERSVREFISETSERISSSSLRHESTLSESSAAAGRYFPILASILSASFNDASSESASPFEDAAVKSSSTVESPVLISSAFASCFCSSSSSASSPSLRFAASSCLN